MGIETTKLIKETAGTLIKEIGDRISKEGVSPKVFDVELLKKTLDSLSEKFSMEPKNLLPESKEVSLSDQATEKIENIENEIDFEPENIKENPEPVIRELSEVGEMLKEFKGDVQELQELVQQLKELKAEVIELIGEDKFNLIEQKVLSELIGGVDGTDEIDEEGDV
ncbi:MAG: hypothetical protein LAT68_16090 [Cyclobacteriaceae bacterium]|nr:hypothetical protein [Cyclobacteriaceae bacterium]MCH8517838.1 hypothetical protein [Cyclobacteriaceae bacterium]